MKTLRVALALIVAVASGACADNLIGPDPGGSPAEVFDLIWSDFDHHYPFFDYKQLDWNQVRAKYAPQAAAAATLDDLAPVISSMFAELRDGHVDLATPDSLYTSIDFSKIHTWFSARTILDNYLTASSLTPSGHIRFARLSSDVGWIRISGFADEGWAGEIDAAISGLGVIGGVVIDVRDNTGGSTGNADPIARRFVVAEKVFSYFRYRNGPNHSDFTGTVARSIKPGGTRFAGKIVVLMNRRSASATEGFLLALRTNAAIVFVGDTSAGSSGDPLLRELPGGWRYRVPHWIQYDADMRIFEGVGIAPDFVVKMTATDSAARRDLQLERALQLARP